MASAVCSRRYSDTSGRSSVGTNATWLTQNGTHAMGKGAVLFTGPSGIRDYKVKVVTDDRMIGIGTMSKEGSSEVNYIKREAPGTAPPTRRSAWVGEVGWMIPEFNDWRSIRSGHQISQGEFRKAQEEKFTHRWQEPWYPAPNHPDYNKQYTFRNHHTMYGNRSKTPSPYATPPPRDAIKRPHTVASFRQDDTGSNFPSLDNQPRSVHYHRPGSAHYSSASEHSVSRPSSGGGYTPIASRPPSGTSSHSSNRSHSNIHNNKDGRSNTSSGHYSHDSRHSGSRNGGARRSSGSSRHSSVRSGSKRMSATPSATTLSSQYSGGNYR